MVWYEWKHFVRSPFKVVALLLFLLAGAYGLHHGAALYETQEAEIARISAQVQEKRQECLAFYEQGKTGPEDRPWVDVTTPSWSLRYAEIHHFKSPSPALVYSIGQAEHFCYYKKVDTWSSPYDNDMTQEIANPERLQTGSLDFSFTLLFLLPLVLLIFLYNLKSQEAELGFLALLEVQAGSTTRWLLCRVLFYVGLLWAVIVLLLLYGALLTPVMTLAPKAFAAMVLYSTLYLLFWTLNYFMILKKGTGIMGNALKMVGMWLIVAFVIPAAVHQWVSIQKPVDFMTEFIDAQRDQLWKLYDLPDSVKQAKVDALFPDIAKSPVAGDSTRLAAAYRTSMPAVANELRKQPLVSIEADNASKNALVRASYPINPVAFFQNRFNRIAHTHYDDYALYRHHIQSLIDKQIRTMVLDTWQDVTVDKQRFLEYQEFLSQP